MLSVLLSACVKPSTPPPIDNPPVDGPPIDNPPVDNPPDDDPTLLQSTVKIVSPPQGVQLFDGISVKVQDVSLPLYAVKVNNVHSWSPNPTTSRSDSGVGYFSLKGKAQISVSAPNLTSLTVRPLSAGISAVVSQNVATFSISSAGNYAIEPNGNPEQAIFLFISAAESQQLPQSNITNVIRFERGVHTSQNSEYINGNNAVVLSSDTTVVLDEGAVVRAKFVANNAQNITICGNGIIDGSTFVRNASTGEVTVPLDFNYCTNVTFKDFSVLDPAGWCVNWYFCSDSNIDNIKIISSRSNGDGISLQSCKNIAVQNCFLRTWDDSLVVKNYPQWSNRQNEGETCNITFSNCTLWTDLAQSMEVGYETVGQKMSDITFQNITVLHNFHKPVISVHNANNADIKNVVYDGVTVEDASMGLGDAGGNNQLCEFAVEFSNNWSTQHKTTALGSIDGIKVKNVTVLSGNLIVPLRVAGSRDMRNGFGATEHFVKNVEFFNVWIKGKPLSVSAVNKNQYTQNVSVVNGESAVVVPFAFNMSAEELAAYTDFAEVVVE